LSAARSQGFLGRLPAEVADEITETAAAVYYPKGTVSFPPSEGAQPAVVLSGLLRYYLSTAAGRQITIRYIGAGDMAGTLTPYGSGLSTAIQAVEPSVLLHLDRPRLDAIARRRPDFAWELLEEMAVRLRFAYSALAATAFTTVRSRVARDLLERARASGRLHSSHRLQVTQQELADATGSVREVVTRAIGELRREGVIATDPSGISILDPDALAAEVGLGAA
jgi:CRP/FNR family transcriptional regulator